MFFVNEFISIVLSQHNTYYFTAFFDKSVDNKIIIAEASVNCD